MKPIMLKIKGINSFAEEQTVDFGQLCTFGLFGIFGPTGSGKSTIIDAITIALYGEVARFENERSKQFINALTDTGWVSLEFALFIEGEVVSYIAERSYKKTMDTQKIVKARLLKKENGEQTVICDKPKQINEEIEGLLGLSYKDFTRAVVLPQGKFSQFLLLVNLERKNMLERIFDLGRYGDSISARIREESRGIREKLDQIGTKLEVYGDVSVDSVKEGEQRIAELEAMKQQTSLENTKAQLEYDKLKQLIKEYDDFCKYQLELTELDSKMTVVDGYKSKIITAQNAALVLPTHNEFERTKALYQQNRSEFKSHMPVLIGHQTKVEASKAQKQASETVAAEQLPLLSERRFKLLQAVELSEKIKALGDEKSDLLIKHKGHKANMDKKAAQLADAIVLKTKWNEELLSITKEMDETNVTPEYREKVAEGNISQAKLEEVQIKIEKMTMDRSKLVTGIAERGNELNENKNKYKISAEKIVEFEKHTETLKANMPWDHKEIIKAKEEIAKMESEFMHNLEGYEKYKRLEKEFLAKKSSHQQLLDKLNEKANVLESIKKELTEIEKQIETEKYHNMAAVIAGSLEENQACPVCGSIHHPAMAENMDNHYLVQLEVNWNNTVKICEQAEKNYGEIVVACGREEEALDRIQKDIEGVADTVIHFNKEAALQLLTDKKKKTREAEDIATKWQQQMDAFENQLKAEKDNFAELTGYIRLLHERLDGLQKNLETSEIQLSELGDIANGEKDKIDKITKEIGKIHFKNEYNNIRKKDKRRVELGTLDKQIKANTNEVTETILKFEKEINELKAKIDEIVTVGKQKAGQLDENHIQLKALTENRDPSEYLKEVEMNMATINEETQKASQIYEADAKTLEQMKKTADGLENQYQTLQKIYAQQLFELNRQITANDFKNMEEFTNAVSSHNNIEKLNNIVKEFDSRLTFVKNYVSELSDKLKGCDTSELLKKEAELVAAISQANKILSEMTEESILLKSEISQKLIHIEKISALKEEEKKLEKRDSLVSELAKLFEGKKFVDFIAKKHLKYIVIDASARLKQMTGSRYAMELDETDFVIRDDFSGGLRRSPKTLSGGETFMASLCLALALSSKVQLKSKASLEFFFLDEGFGSLDGDALNTVMDVLVKLRGQNINVGVISHVEQMKTQMPKRLIVIPPVHGFTGSTVRME